MVKKFKIPGAPEDHPGGTIYLNNDGEPVYDREADFTDVQLQVVDEAGPSAFHWLTILRLAKKYLDLKEAIENRPGELYKDLIENGKKEKE